MNGFAPRCAPLAARGVALLVVRRDGASHIEEAPLPLRGPEHGLTPPPFRHLRDGLLLDPLNHSLDAPLPVVVVPRFVQAVDAREALCHLGVLMEAARDQQLQHLEMTRGRHTDGEAATALLSNAIIRRLQPVLVEDI